MRASTGCAALHPAVCWTCAYIASPCRIMSARSVALRSAAACNCSSPTVEAMPGTRTTALASAVAGPPAYNYGPK